MLSADTLYSQFVHSSFKLDCCGGVLFINAFSNCCGGIKQLCKGDCATIDLNNSSRYVYRSMCSLSIHIVLRSRVVGYSCFYASAYK